MEHQRGRYVVGKIGDHDGLSPTEQLLVVRLEGVGVVDRDAVGRHHRSERIKQVPVDFHRVHLGPRLHERQRQRSQSRADLEHQVAGSDLGESGDATHRVGVHHEVLSERARRLQSVLFEQGDELGAGVGHQETRTWMTPLASGASWANWYWLRSMTRFPRAASRSVIVQTITRPVERSRTFTLVP